jgi:hypothetical protein
MVLWQNGSQNSGKDRLLQKPTLQIVTKTADF